MIRMPEAKPFSNGRRQQSGVMLRIVHCGQQGSGLRGQGKSQIQIWKLIAELLLVQNFLFCRVQSWHEAGKQCLKVKARIDR